MSEQTLRPNQFEKLMLDLFTRTTSICIMTLGRRDTGKTDLSLLIMEILQKFDAISCFATNIKIYEAPFPIEHITNLEDLEFWCRNNQSKNSLFLMKLAKV